MNCRSAEDQQVQRPSRHLRLRCVFPVLGVVRLRRTDQGRDLCGIRWDDDGGILLRHFAPPHRRPAMRDARLSEADPMARGRVGAGERGRMDAVPVTAWLGFTLQHSPFFLQCSRSCGSGSRERQVICCDRERNLYPVAQCNAHPKPSRVERCNTQACYSPQRE